MQFALSEVANVSLHNSCQECVFFIPVLRNEAPKVSRRLKVQRLRSLLTEVKGTNYLLGLECCQITQCVLDDYNSGG